MLLTWPPYRRINQQVQGNHQETITETCLTYLFFVLRSSKQEKKYEINWKGRRKLLQKFFFRIIPQEPERTNRVAFCVWRTANGYPKKQGIISIPAVFRTSRKGLQGNNCCLRFLLIANTDSNWKNASEFKSHFNFLLTKASVFRKRLVNFKISRTFIFNNFIKY